MTDDQLCCMILNGLRNSSFSDIRTRFLQVIESKLDVTLLQLETEIKRLIDICADDNYAAGSTPAKTSDINATDTHYKRDEKKKRAFAVLRMLQMWRISLGQNLQSERRQVFKMR